MTLPIVAYGDPVLRKEATPVDKDHPGLSDLITNMWETMYKANGLGLAAPQVGVALRIFVIDTQPFSEDENLPQEEQEFLRSFKKVFINARMDEESGNNWAFNEGCLSIPDIHEDVTRKDTITLTFLDENFNSSRATYTGLLARVIQHEYDHIEGILFTDKISSLKKRLLKGKLLNISKGNIDVEYKMRFPLLKKGR